LRFGPIIGPSGLPLHRMTFNDLNLNSSLLKALDELGLKEPTAIQQKAFSVIMSGKDVCGIAQTGTGKTFAYLLPCLRMWKFAKDRFPQILVIVPTRELVVQVVDAIKQLTPYMNVEAVAAFGGVNMKTQIAPVENGCDIVVATPGRLLDLVYHGALKLKNIKKLVIDEMDEMLNLGFRKQLSNILELLPERRQNLMFSATITDEVEALMHDFFNAPVRIEATPVGTPLANIEQSVYRVPNFNTKINLLRLLLQNDAMSKVMVFVETRAMADDVYEQLLPAFEGQMGIIHSNKDQNFRFNTVKQFLAGGYRFIIATDIIARGIDVAGVSHVINFDTPDVAEHYVHRIGRTGRADKKGIAITFTADREVEYLQAIEQLMSYEVPVVSLPADLEISDVLTDDEKPKVKMKEYLIALPKREESGGAFHEKLEKNKKVPLKIRHADKMREKYGKPKKRPPKNGRKKK